MIVAKALSYLAIFRFVLGSPVDLATQEGRGRERYRRMAMTAVAAAGARIVTIATSLISVPLTLHYLGREQYGIWMVLSSFTVMLSFADMGLGNGVLNAIAREHGRGDRTTMREVVSSGYAMLGIISALILLAFAAVYPFVPWYQLFNVKSLEARAAAGPALAVFSICFALAIPLNIVQKIQIGLQQGFVNSLWQALASLSGLAAVIVVIYIRGSLSLLVLALVGPPLVVSLLNTVSFFAREGRDLRPSPRAVSRAAARVVIGTGGMFFFVQIVGALAFGADTLIVAQLAGADAVAQYAVPERLFALISMVVSIALAPLWPAYGEAIARGDSAWISRTFRRSLLAAAVLSGALSLVLVVLGKPLIHLWVGDVVQPSLFLLVGLGFWRVVESCGNAMAYYMNGANLMWAQATIGFVSALFKIALKVALVGTFGVAGIPWGATVAFVLTCAIPYLFIIRRHIATRVNVSGDE
jgi:O-antigen/teichoic acid export membrane protein